MEFTDGTSFDEMDCHVAKAYIAAVKAIDSDHRTFSTTSECAVCKGTGHPFSDCMALKDVEFLKKHHIAYCVNQRRLRKMLTTRAAVHWLHTVQADNDEEPPAPDFR